MEAAVQNTPSEDIKPPATSVGVIGWVRANLFNGWFNSLLTIATIALLYKTVPPLVRWAFIDSVWHTTGAGLPRSRGRLLVGHHLQYQIYNLWLLSL